MSAQQVQPNSPSQDLMRMKLVCLIVVVIFLTLQQTEAGELQYPRYWGPYKGTKQSDTREDVQDENLVGNSRGRRSGDDDDADDDDDKTSNVVRAITMIIILIVSMIFGMLPLKTLSMKYRSRIASIANCFGGGVFFGTCFMHLIPEVKMQINAYVEYMEDKVTAGLAEGEKPPGYLEFLEKLPIPEFLECSGFLLILSIEKIAESAKKIRPLTQRFSVFISTKKLNAAQKLVNKQQDLEVRIVIFKIFE